MNVRKTFARLTTLSSGAAVALLSLSAASMPAHAAPTIDPGAHTLHVVKTPTCGCCQAWVELAREHGYEVEVTDMSDYVAMKKQAAVPEPLWACHTTGIEGYVVEGHVPFAAIDKLLAERPDIAGIAVPGMPGGSPGMGNDPSAVFDVTAYGGSADDGEVFYTAGR